MIENDDPGCFFCFLQHQVVIVEIRLAALTNCK